MGINPKTQFLDGDDAQRPLLDTPGPSMQPGPSAPSAPPLPTSTLSAPALASEFPDPVKPDASGAVSSFQAPNGGGGYGAVPAVERGGDYPAGAGYPAPGYPAYPPPIIDYPAQGGYSAQPYMSSPLLEINTRTIIVTPLSDASVVVTCPHCGYRGPTLVDKESGFCTWLSSFTLCFLGCCVLSLLPFCCSATKDIVHRCANCGCVLGRRRP